MDDIRFKKDRVEDRESITLHFTDEEKKAVALYDSLKREYNVDTPAEARNAILERMRAIAEKFKSGKAS